MSYFNNVKQVEGEIDKLSLEEAGFRNCVSVPDGAPASVANNIPQESEVSQLKTVKKTSLYSDPLSF